LDRDEFRKLLEEVATGRIEVGTALDRVQGHGIEELGFARLDTGREQRTGIAEVIFAPGKTADQLDVIVERCLAKIETELAEPLLARFDVLRYHAIARILEARPEREAKWPSVAVVSAGTSDQPVAEEAAVVLEHLGHSVDRITDVGVAGIHRLLSVLDRLRRARALVVAAGMEGALPSVVAGLVDRPVVAVPTSVGYGASFGGVAALLGMLNSCAAGIGVVNIDNGFGAATLVHRIATSDGGETDA
jgi:NCAIR mutase (PurE)-related protein